MPTSIMSPSTTAGETAATITLADGASTTLALYVASGDIPQDAIFDVLVDTPGADVQLFTLTHDEDAMRFFGPVSLIVKRRSCSVATGVSRD